MGAVGGEELKLGGEEQCKSVMMAHGEQECPNQQGTCQRVCSSAKGCFNYSCSGVHGIRERNPVLLVLKLHAFREGLQRCPEE